MWIRIYIYIYIIRCFGTHTPQYLVNGLGAISVIRLKVNTSYWFYMNVYWVNSYNYSTLDSFDSFMKVS